MDGFQQLTPHQLACHQAVKGAAAQPRPVRAFDTADHLFSGMNDAARCLSWLVAEGFEPISTLAARDRAFPIITIEVCPACEMLKEKMAAYTYGWKPECGQRAILWRTEKFGCRIEWQERGR